MEEGHPAIREDLAVFTFRAATWGGWTESGSYRTGGNGCSRTFILL